MWLARKQWSSYHQDGELKTNENIVPGHTKTSQEWKKTTTTQWFCSTETNIKFQKWRIKKTLPSGAESTRAYHKSLCIYHRYHKNHVQTFVAGGARTHYAVPARLMTTLAHSRVSRLVKRFPQQMFKKSPIFSTKIGQRFPNGGFGERKRRDILKVAILPC